MWVCHTHADIWYSLKTMIFANYPTAFEKWVPLPKEGEKTVSCWASHKVRNTIHAFRWGPWRLPAHQTLAVLSSCHVKLSSGEKDTCTRLCDGTSCFPPYAFNAHSPPPPTLFFLPFPSPHPLYLIFTAPWKLFSVFTVGKKSSPIFCLVIIDNLNLFITYLIHICLKFNFE